MPKPKKKYVRAGIPKSLRFDVFHRDGFRCRYCGKSSEEVTLVIDHMIPVSKGGTNDIANLVTSCDPCNSGKSDKTIEDNPDNESARLAMLQLAREQMAEAQAAIDAVKAENEYRQLVIDSWCEITGRDSVDKGTITVMVGYAKQFGIALVLEWARKANWRVGNNDRNMGRYVSGIKRKYLEEREASNEF